MLRQPGNIRTEHADKALAGSATSCVICSEYSARAW